MEELSLSDMLTIFQRRKRIFFLIFSVTLLLALIFVMNWRNYRATATVQIEQSFISPTITNPITNPNEEIETLADQRINQIQQKVTSLESLAQIISKFNLYPGEADTTPIALLTSQMRKKIKVEFINGNLSNPAAAQKQTAEQLSAIAFDLSFEYKEPKLAQLVTSELVARFIDEDLKIRRTQTQETSAFLAKQISALESAMATQEKAIAEFRAKNGESGPTALIFNQQSVANLALSIETVGGQITSNEGTISSLRAQLALVEPYSRVVADGQLLTTPAIQLKALETQYATLSGQYGPAHPDIVKLRSQIRALKAQLGSEQPDAKLEAQIADIRTNLEAAESMEGPDHPDVIALQKQLDALEATQKKNGKKTESDGDSDGIIKDADNPAYLQISSQLQSAEAQHKALLKQRDALKAQQAKYERSIATDPQIEEEMAKLTRDYDNSQLRYRELKEKKMSADMNEQLEVGRKGQRLEVSNPPGIPGDTHPRHILLMLGALFVAIGAGLGGIILAEATDQNVHGINQLGKIVGAMPLVVIPHMLTGHEKNQSLRYKNYFAAAETLLVVLKMVLLRVAAKSYQAMRQLKRIRHG